MTIPRMRELIRVRNQALDDSVAFILELNNIITRFIKIVFCFEVSKLKAKMVWILLENIQSLSEKCSSLNQYIQKLSHNVKMLKQTASRGWCTQLQYSGIFLTVGER